MRILPVLDIRGGIVVGALAGRRSEYLPLVTRLTDSTDPVDVAEAIRGKYGWSQYYVADLDAITSCALAPCGGGLGWQVSATPHPDPRPQGGRGQEGAGRDVYNRLRAAGFRLWLDAGVREPADANSVASYADKVVVALETLCDLASWREILFGLGPERAVFSLDLRDGRPLRGPADPLVIAEQVWDAGGRQLIVLDLAGVGTGGGPSTANLCAELVRRYAGVSVYTGGGIRGWDDIRRLEDVGVAGVLIASALHNGGLDQPIHS